MRQPWEAACDGEPLDNDLSGECGEAYRRGYESVIFDGPGGPESRTPDAEAGSS